MSYWKLVTTEKTETECFLRQLFGHTSRTVRETGDTLDIEQGDTLFLHRLKMEENDLVSGPFVATCSAKKNIDNNAWHHKSHNFNWQVEMDWINPVYTTTINNIVNKEGVPIEIQNYPQSFSETQGLWLTGVLEDGMQIVSYP